MNRKRSTKVIAGASIPCALIVASALVLAVAIYGDAVADAVCAVFGGNVLHTWNGRLFCEHKK